MRSVIVVNQGRKRLLAFPTSTGAGAAASVLTAAVLAVLLGLLVAETPMWQAAGLAAVPLVLLGLSWAIRRASGAASGVPQLALIWTLLVASTFVWRARTTEDLDSNPLDTAGLVRVTLVALAGVIALALSTRVSRPSKASLAGGVGILALYVLAATISAVGSPIPTQASYRVLELSVGLLVIVLARSLLGDRAGEVLLRFVVVTIAALTVLIWVEAVAMPSQAWHHPYFHAIAPYVLTGAVPSFASNTVGTLGAFLAIWGLARVQRDGQQLAWAALALGLLTLIAAQYRTGMAAFLLAAIAVLGLRRRLFLAGMALLALVLTLFLLGKNQFIIEQTTAAFTKGESAEQLQSLNSRTAYWDPAWRLTLERPSFGWGLNVGGRLAVSSIGNESTSTTHSTWVEALVGTGFIGVLTLALAVIVTFVQALRSRNQPLSIVVVGFMIVLLIRSLTGTTIELFSIFFLIFAALATTASALSRQRSVGALPTQT